MRPAPTAPQRQQAVPSCLAESQRGCASSHGPFAFDGAVPRPKHGGPELEAKATARRPVAADDYRARSVLFVPDQARLSGLVLLPEGDNLGNAIDAEADAYISLRWPT